MKKIFLFVLFTVLLTMLTACAGTLASSDTTVQFTVPSANPAMGQPTPSGQVAGLGTGVWHGFLSIVTLFISFLNPAVQMYEVHNYGSLYNLGFLLGVALLFVSLVFVRSRSRG
jgi:hypothetical protein